MKKQSILLLSMIATAMTIVSCDPADKPADQPTETPTAGTLEGKWNFTKMQLTSDGVTGANQTFGGNTSGCENDYFLFEAAGTATYGDYDLVNCTPISNDLTYTKTGNKLAITGLDTEVVNFEIVSLTSKQLKLKETDGGDYIVYTLVK